MNKTTPILKRPTMPAIVGAVCQSVDVKQIRLTEVDRMPHVVTARRAIAYIAYATADQSFPQIAYWTSRTPRVMGAKTSHTGTIERFYHAKASMARAAETGVEDATVKAIRIAAQTLLDQGYRHPDLEAMATPIDQPA
jgi:hypothetical protein